MEDKPPEFDFDALLRSTAVETYNKEGINELMLGDMVQGLARTSSLDALPPSVIHGGVVAPEFRDVPLGNVLEAVVAQQISGTTIGDAAPKSGESTLNVAQCMDIWAREMQTGMQQRRGHGPHIIMSGSVLPLNEGPLHDRYPSTSEGQNMTTRRSETRKQKNSGKKAGTRQSGRRKNSTERSSDGGSRGRRVTKEDHRSVKNRESAAKSRKKRQQYTNELEQRVQMLKDTNKELRKKIICAAKAPPDPYAGTLDGTKLRRTRTMPL